MWLEFIEIELHVDQIHNDHGVVRTDMGLCVDQSHNDHGVVRTDMGLCVDQCHNDHDVIRTGWDCMLTKVTMTMV